MIHLRETKEGGDKRHSLLFVYLVFKKSFLATADFLSYNGDIMYVVFYGTDRGKVRDAATKYIEEKMSPDSTLSTIDSAAYQTGQISDALGATSLFGNDEWFLVDSPAENTECSSEVKDSLKEMSESKNYFVILEGKLLAPEKKKYQKYAADIKEYAADVVEKINAFSLAEALADKDRRKLWVLLQVSRRRKQPPEATIGMLWWQLKALRLATITSSASEAGMKSFAYQKAKQAAGKFKEGEVERLADSLLRLYHDGHAGLCDIDLALEAWVLRG